MADDINQVMPTCLLVAVFFTTSCTARPLWDLMEWRHKGKGCAGEDAVQWEEGEGCYLERSERMRK